MIELVAISAGGLIDRPSIIVEGKNIMRSWFGPLSVDELNHEPELTWLTREQSFPPHAVVKTSEKSSTDMRLIKHLLPTLIVLYVSTSPIITHVF